ncbi:MAG: signal peptide peptidase SppA [Alphaproteobacteria bacterium]
MRVLARIVLFAFAALGVVTSLAILGGAVAVGVALSGSRPAVLPAHMILTVDLEAPMAERGDGLSLLGDQPPYVLNDVASAIYRAAGDKRVDGLIATVGTNRLGLAQIQELRDAIAAFRASGKFTYAYADTFGELRAGMEGYYLASSFERIWLQPSGQAAITGVGLEGLFLKGGLDKLGLAADFEQRHEFKGAADMFTRRDFSPGQRQMLGRLVDSWFGQITDAIAHARNKSPAEIRALVDRAPLLAAEARDGGLVDVLGYADDMDEAADAKASPDAVRIDVAGYAAAAPTPRRAARVALLHALGPIHRGQSEDSPFGGGPATTGSFTLIDALQAASEEADVRAIILRIDSPGGSYVASDSIAHAIAQARAKGKPVIVSMGNVAASGGYFIAAPATRIVAEPGTITGSIGVVAGKLVAKELLDKLGVSLDSVSRGANAGMWSPGSLFSPGARARLTAFMDAAYEDFTAQVARGRNLSAAEVDLIARGRVWSGADAKARGLVDELGGMETAIALARREAALEPGAAIELVPFPQPRSTVSRILDFIAQPQLDGSAKMAMLFWLARGDADLRQLQRLLAPVAPLDSPSLRVR